VPYISAAMLDEKDKTYYDLSGGLLPLPAGTTVLILTLVLFEGALVYDAVIGQFLYTQEEVVAVAYVIANQNILNLNDTFLATLEGLDESCGYAALREKYLTFPPPGNHPSNYFNFTSEANCDVFDEIDSAALEVNLCFDIYEINQQCPLL